MTKRNAVFLCALCLAGTLLAETLHVQVQTGQVRDTPSFLGQVVATVAYRQTVETTGTQDAWVKVQTSDGKAGWMHRSALTTKRIAPQAGGATVAAGASGDELALAGKGIISDIEAQFKSGHPEIDYTWVDKMVKMNATPGQIAAFTKAGGLKQNGGAQ